MGPETRRLPKSQGPFVVDQDFQGNRPTSLPHFLLEFSESCGTQPPATVLSVHEKLAQVDMILVHSIKEISHEVPAVLKQKSPVISLQPRPHPPLKLGQSHPVAASLVQDQLLVPVSQKRKIGFSGGNEDHMFFFADFVPIIHSIHGHPERMPFTEIGTMPTSCNIQKKVGMRWAFFRKAWLGWNPAGP